MIRTHSIALSGAIALLLFGCSSPPAGTRGSSAHEVKSSASLSQALLRVSDLPPRFEVVNKGTPESYVPLCNVPSPRLASPVSFVEIGFNTPDRRNMVNELLASFESGKLEAVWRFTVESYRNCKRWNGSLDGSHFTFDVSTFDPRIGQDSLGIAASTEQEISAVQPPKKLRAFAVALRAGSSMMILSMAGFDSDKDQVLKIAAAAADRLRQI